jgi:hypothetical protein
MFEIIKIVIQAEVSLFGVMSAFGSAICAKAAPPQVL